MKFMILVKANRDSEAGVMPSQELLTAMGQYNEQLVKAGFRRLKNSARSSSAPTRTARSCA